MILILSIVFTISVVGAFLAPYPTYKAFNVVMVFTAFMILMALAKTKSEPAEKPDFSYYSYP
jgi:hypothetical protein